MKKIYFTVIALSLVIMLPAFAGDAVFSNSDSEQFNLQPLNYSSKPIVYSGDTKSYSTTTTSVQELKSKATDSTLSNKNFMSAVNNLDNAQVEIREQLASYSALMEQAKTNYQSKKDEYRGYKTEYNALKRKMRKIEKSKKLIQNNIQVEVNN